MWDSTVVGARCRLWLVREGFCSPSSRVVHTFVQLFVHPCRASSVFVPVGRCMMIRCQWCDPGTAAGVVVCSWPCNHTAVSAFAVMQSSPSAVWTFCGGSLPLWCRLRPPLRRLGCCEGDRELRELVATVAEVKGEENVAGCHIQAGGQGWGCGLREVVGVEVLAVGAVVEAVCGP